MIKDVVKIILLSIELVIWGFCQGSLTCMLCFTNCKEKRDTQRK